MRTLTSPIIRYETGTFANSRPVSTPQHAKPRLILNTADAHVIDREPLLVSTARILGWARLGADIRARLESALDDAVSDGQLIEQHGQVRVP